METARGVEYGYVVVGTKEVEDKKIIQPLKPVIRIATQEDDTREAANRFKEKRHLKSARKRLRSMDWK